MQDLAWLAFDALAVCGLVWISPYVLMAVVEMGHGGIHWPLRARISVECDPEFRRRMTRRGLIGAASTLAVTLPPALIAALL